MKGRQILFCVFLCVLIGGLNNVSYAQTPATHTATDSIPKQRSLADEYDISDLFVDLFHPAKKADSTRKQRRSPITYMPNIAYNPSIGAQIGIKAVAGKVLGKDPNTLMSVGATSASITTKGIIYFYLSHNVYTNANRWNFQGSLVVAKTVSPDRGIGIGYAPNDDPNTILLTNPGRTEVFVQKAIYYKFQEKVYKQIFNHLFVGAGLSFDIRNNIKQGSHDVKTPYELYNEKYGFADDHYAANGFLFNVQYTTRDNQNQAFRGIYADVGVRTNQTWLGSSKSVTQITTDFRKYWSLSKENPEHVIAFWHWGAYTLNGAMPYMELAGSARDLGARSARAYTFGYFRGPNYFDSELEYRFPILKNKFISGATFFSMQTASDGLGTKLFDRWQPAGGAGLRVLFNKATRTNLCIDYAIGKYGAKGLFLGLNEAF